MGTKNGAKNFDRFHPGLRKENGRKGGLITGGYIRAGKKMKKGKLNNPL